MSNQAKSKINLMITGQGGFVGKHLLRMASAPERAFASYDILPHTESDLLIPESIERMIGPKAPDAVIHLAGQTSVPTAIADPSRTLQINVIGTLNLLQALKKCGFRGVFLYVSSGDIYGTVSEQRLPITEDEPPKPRNPYAVSKAAAELLCLQWSRVEPWRIMVARPFNHIGAGQRPDFVISEVARQITRIQQRRQSQALTLGNIDLSRDFLDVEDVISAYFALLEHGANGEIYNICSGTEFVIRDLITQMLELAGIDASIEKDHLRFRPADQRRVVGNNAKLRAATGWQPRKNIRESLQTVLRDWQARDEND